MERFSKMEMRAGKTPDFRVSRNDEFQFYCEVKSISADRWLDEQIKTVAPGELAGGARNDPIFNRLTADVHEALKQFDAVNKDQQYPNVLVLVNHDDMCGFNDLLGILTGNAFANDGTTLPIYRQFSHGRIKGETGKIHLYVWLDDYKPERLLFSQVNEVHNETLCALFGCDPDEVTQI